MDPVAGIDLMGLTTIVSTIPTDRRYRRRKNFLYKPGKIIHVLRFFFDGLHFFVDDLHCFGR